MNSATTWLGAVGGGFGASAIVGGGVYQMNLWNMQGNPVPIRAMIVGKRLGVMLQAEAAHAVCILTGVASANDFTTLRSSGVDWTLALGIKADAFFKGSAGGAKVLAELAAHTGNWAMHESAKKAVQGIMGDFTLSSRPSFVLLPTPIALGAGAGIWYEWQTLSKVGSDIAWEYIKPWWWMEERGGRLMLRMANIPEQDGTQINFRIRTDNWGPDDAILFARGPNQAGEVNLRGVVYDGRLHDAAAPGARTGFDDGFDLSNRYPVGRSVTGMLSVSRNAEVARNTTIKVGVSISRGQINLFKWESRKYLKVRTGPDGRFVSPEHSNWMS